MLTLFLFVATGPRALRGLPSPLCETPSAAACHLPLQRFESCFGNRHPLASTSSVFGSLWPEHCPEWMRPILPAASVPDTRGAVREVVTAPDAALTLTGPSSDRGWRGHCPAACSTPGPARLPGPDKTRGPKPGPGQPCSGTGHPPPTARKTRRPPRHVPRCRLQVQWEPGGLAGAGTTRHGRPA